MTALRTSAPVDDFLAGAGADSAGGRRLEAIGQGLSVGGAVVTVGLLGYLVWVHRGLVAEIAALLRIVVVGGLVTLVGAVVEIAGTAVVLDEAWSQALTDDSAAAAMMRLLGGLLVVLGLAEETVPVGGLPGVPATEGADPDAVRWWPGAGSAFGLVGAATVVLSFGFDGHTVTEGPRLVHAAVDAVHVVAGAVWVGGVLGLLATAVLRRRSETPAIGELFVRFSRLATIALGAVLSAGAAMAWMILDRPGELTSTPWGQRLLMKSAAVAIAVMLGARNHFVLAPRLARGDGAAERAARTSIAVESIVLTFVVVATAFLVRSSTN